jgi:hypothetical protein
MMPGQGSLGQDVPEAASGWQMTVNIIINITLHEMAAILPARIDLVSCLTVTECYLSKTDFQISLKMFQLNNHRN